MIGLSVENNEYVAIGDQETGYFFLPPFDVWQQWAKQTLKINITTLITKSIVPYIEIWSNGTKIVIDGINLKKN
ncbi:hypothetical protein MT997_28615 [Paenibacillus sp. OVF10]|nr:hypothetical protein MT997_28615 [Paenibacillus sp. OVF10]